MQPRVLITGGTGFLGKHLASSLKRHYEVILTGRNQEQNFLSNRITHCPVFSLDVTNIESVRDVFAEVKPDIVIHAAATKFVDIAEQHPLLCTDVNVVGSQNVARVAIDKGVKTVIGISTDKASPPIKNIYGLSKALMERLFCSLNGKTETRFMCVRYGNVAWSTGSVFPTWRQMQNETGIIRSRGIDMSRFFFTVHEAVALIQTALEQSDSLQGKVLARCMKASEIRAILDVWIEEFGGKWVRIDACPGDRPFEYLIGESELENTNLVNYGGVSHYVISFNDLAPHPLKEIVSSENVEQLTREEISQLIQEAPKAALEKYA